MIIPEIFLPQLISLMNFSIRFIYLSALATCLAQVSTAEYTAKPNIVLIYADDLGKYDLEFYSEKDHDLTPNIDRLFREGASFSDAYSPAALCAPSRIGLMSGRYPASLGSFEVAPGSPMQYGFAGWEIAEMTPPENSMQLPSSKVLPEYLRDLGYTNGFVGKWHMQPMPVDRGFSYAVETRNVNRGGSHMQSVQARSSDGDTPKVGERSDEYELRKSLDFLESVR